MLTALLILLLFPEFSLQWDGKKRRYLIMIQGVLSALTDAFNKKEALLFYYKSEEINEED